MLLWHGRCHSAEGVSYFTTRLSVPARYGVAIVAVLAVFAVERTFSPLVNQGELAVLYCFVWLYFSAAGPGPWSVDALLQRRPATT